jgi:hypothetical protein
MLATLCAAIVFSQDFNTPNLVAEPERLALTPTIDGVIDPNEWDAFSGEKDRETYLQWEPGKLHAAANLAAGQDLVLSLDASGNGWLIGKDNFQIRLTWENGVAKLTAQRLDATNPGGPIWLDEPDIERVSVAKGRATENGWAVELSIGDPAYGILPESPESKIGIRLDSVAAGTGLEPFLPRNLVPCKFGYERGSSLPAGFKWNAQLVSRTAPPGGNMKIRLTFNGSNEMNLQRIDMETRGPGSAEATKLSTLFPKFDRKGRAFVDYLTGIPADAEEGYRILRAVVTDPQGNAAFLRTSYRVAPIVELDIATPTRLKSEDKEQKVRVSFFVRSNSTRKLEGTTTINLPQGWQLVTGEDKRFIIANGRGSVRRVFDAIVPAGAKGSFPITIHAELGDRKFQQTGWIRLN